MADESIRTIFAAEFDTSPVQEGAKAVVDSFKTMREEIATLKEQTEALKVTNEELGKSSEQLAAKNEELKTTNDSLSKSNRALDVEIKAIDNDLKQIQKQMDLCNKTTQAGITQYNGLSKASQQLKTEQQGLESQIAINNKVIADNSKAITSNIVTSKTNTDFVKTNEKAIASNSATIKENNKALAATEKASAGAGIGIGKMYSVLRQTARILPGIGIAGLIGLIVELGEKGLSSFISLREALSDFKKDLATSKEIQEQANKSFSQGYAQLELMRAKLTDLSIPEKERLALLKEYNKTADANNQIDKTQLDNTNAINDAIDRQIGLLKDRALARASEAVIGEKAEKLLNAQLASRQKTETELDAEKNFTGGIVVQRTPLKSDKDPLKAGSQEMVYNATTKKFEQRILTEEDVKQFNKQAKGVHDKFRAQKEEDRKVREAENNKDVIDAQAELDRAVRFGLQFTTAQGLTTDSGQKTPKGREIENVFLQKLAELRAKLAASSASEFQSEGLIREKFSAQLDKEFVDIGALLKQKKLTIPQAEILKGLIDQINQIDLAKSLGEFRKKQKDAMDRIDEAILSASLEAGQKRISNIRDEFEREGQTIEQNYQTTVASLNKKVKELLKQVQDDVNKGLLTEAQGKQKGLLLTAIFGDLLDQTEAARRNAELELSFKQFEDTINESKRNLDNVLLLHSENVSQLIQKETQAYLTGATTYDTYQKRLTKILRDEVRARNEERLKELRSELDSINNKIKTNSDPTIEKKLQDQQRSVRAQIAGLSREIDEGEGKDKQDKIKKRVDSILAYAQAVQGLLQQIGNVWNQINAIEQAALERSISYQQQRVDRAKDIADKGNAEYLEQEQKRLDDLERRHEENARKTMAINAALTLSQALVATISAIAQATATGSPIAGIAAVAAVIGAIGAAYAFVSSLQTPPANFFEGTEYVEGKGRPRGKDTVPARLTIGERVVTADKNSEYWDTLHAIHNGHIPAGVINNFVKAYPTVDYARLSNATGGKFGSDSFEVTTQLEETNRKLDTVASAIGQIALSANIDIEGFSFGLNRHVKRQSLKNRS